MSDTFGAMFGRLMKQRRAKRFTQGQLAALVWPGDSEAETNRKGDISKIETGKVRNPQATTVQKIADVLEISADAISELRRQAQVSDGERLQTIPTLSREELENLAARFQIEGVYDRSDPNLRELLTKKAEEYRALKAEVDMIPDSMKRLANLKTAAQNAIAQVNLDEVEKLMSMVHEAELEEAAKSAEIRADTALLRGDVEKAYQLLSSAADSFAVVSSLEPAKRRILGSYKAFPTLYYHGMKYGGDAVSKAVTLIEPILNQNLRDQDEITWAAGQNNLAVAFKSLGTRKDGEAGLDFLRKSVQCYREALEVRTRHRFPLEWAKTQSNLALVLRYQAARSEPNEASQLLDEAISAYHSALEVHLQKEFPTEWAQSLTNLGIALKDKALFSEANVGLDLLNRALGIYREALGVYSRTDNPESWATIQNLIGNALRHVGQTTAYASGSKHFSDAFRAFENALDVRRRDTMPVQWAESQSDLARAYYDFAVHAACAAPEPHLTLAFEAVDKSLTVYDPIHMSYNHRKAMRLRDRIQGKIRALDDNED